MAREKILIKESLINTQVRVDLQKLPNLQDAEGNVIPAKQTRTIVATGMTANAINQNNRIYPLEVVKQAIDEATQNIMAGRPLVGQIDHPDEYDAESEKLKKVAVNWRTIQLKGNSVELRGLLSPDSVGQRVESFIAMEMTIGISMRGYGFVEPIEINGQVIYQIVELHLQAFDFVLHPADANGKVLTMEAVQMDAGTSNLDTLKQKHPDAYSKIEAEFKAKALQESEAAKKLADEAKSKEAETTKLADLAKLELAHEAEKEALKIAAKEQERQLRQTLGISDDVDLMQVITDNANKAKVAEQEALNREIRKFITDSLAKTAYPQPMKNGIMDGVMEQKPTSVEVAKRMLDSQFKIFDSIMVSSELSKKGATVPNLKVAPVFETETKMPEYFRPAYQIMESLQIHNIGPRWKPMSPTSKNQNFAARYLEHAAKSPDFAEKLRDDLNRFNEAGTTTADLNLPYSVMMGIIAQAVPQLVASSIFPFGLMTSSVELAYFDRLSNEDDKFVVVNDEAVVAVHDTDVKLTGSRIKLGSVSVRVGSTVMTLGDDYLLDCVDGTIQALSDGAITNGATMLVDYSYENIRRGENQAIQRAKTRLDRIIMEAKADRLATVLTDEALLFTQSQLGDNLLTRSLGQLVNDIRKTIDGNIFAKAINAAMRVRNNNAGNWSSTNDSLDKFAELVGQAKSLIVNRYYPAEFLLISYTSGEKLSNWKDFSAAGMRADSELYDNGFVGKLKGLPVYHSTEFTDGYGLVGNSQLILHRVFKAMALKGPHPVREEVNGKLIAAQEYYVEEYNSTAVPVNEKASYFTIS